MWNSKWPDHLFCVCVCMCEDARRKSVPFVGAGSSLPQGAGWVLRFHPTLSKAVGREQSSVAAGGFVSLACFVQWTSAEVNYEQVYTSQSHISQQKLEQKESDGVFIKMFWMLHSLMVLEVKVAMISFITFTQSSESLPLPQPTTITEPYMSIFNTVLWL